MDELDRKLQAYVTQFQTPPPLSQAYLEARLNSRREKRAMTWQLVIGSTLSALAGCLSLWGMALAWEALPSKAFWAWGLYHGSFPLALLLGGAVLWQTKGRLANITGKEKNKLWDS